MKLETTQRCQGRDKSNPNTHCDIGRAGRKPFAFGDDFR